MGSTPSDPLRETFRGLVGALTDVGADFAVIGALARGAWADPRATTDVDVQVAADVETWTRLVRNLEARGFRRARQTPAVDPSDPVPDQAFFRSRAGVRADILIAKTPFEKEALARKEIVELLGDEVPVVTAEDLIVYKVLAGRPRDVADVVAVIDAALAADRDIDWPYVERWCAAWDVSDRLAELRRQAEGE